jgi:isoquinoline 1-oxidoreductase subunit beta
MKRRSLLLWGAGAGGALLVGFAALPPRSRLGRASDAAALLGTGPGASVPLNGWVRIGAQGEVELVMPRSEMGQGVHHSLALMVAEELDLHPDQVKLVSTGFDAIYGNVAMFAGGLPFHPSEAEPGQESWRVRAGQWTLSKLARELNINATGGSSTIADLFVPLRLAAATARAQLLGAASLQWKLPVAELACAEGLVSHPSGPRAGFADLAAAASRTSVSDVQMKPRAQWRLLGTVAAKKPAPRRDALAKSTGQAGFGIDVRLPGLLYAVVIHAPALGGGVGAFKPDAALKQPGVLRVVRLGTEAGATQALAVLGRSSWHAKRGAQALEVDWRGRPAGVLDSDAIMASLEAVARSAEGAFAFRSTGDAAQAIEQAPKKVQALYRAPYLAHATLEPMNCTARVAEGGVELWLPTQVPGLARALAAQVAGVPVERVKVNVTLLGGGFGRRLDIDFVGQAVRVAMEAGGAPVQLLWPREEDFTHDFYRPAGAAFMRAGLGADGSLLAWDICSAGDAPAPRWMARAISAHDGLTAGALASAGDLQVPALLQPLLAATAGPLMTPDKTANEGLHDQAYAVPAERIRHVATRSGVPVGFWRAVGHSHNAFFAESFVDELAHAAGADPLAFRLNLLKNMPRHRAVLELAARQAGWGQPLPAGVARGLALHESFGSIVAQVVEASRSSAADKAPAMRVLRVVCAVDCGTVLSPDIVAQQLESSIVFGLTAALHGEITVRDSVVQQRNFPDQPLLRLADCPRIETHLIDSPNPPAGIGEPGLPPVAPALANAWFALTGQRLRDLPLRPPAAA